MARVPPTISTLRWTARLLLIATPLVILSGFLTAKPFLLEAIGYGTARTVHTAVAPLVFVPLLLVHSTAGILYLIGRNKRLNKRWFRLGAAGGWAALLVALTALYFIGPPAPAAATGADEPAPAGDAGPEPARAPEAGPGDAGPGPEATTDADRPSTGDAAADAGPPVPAVRLPEKLPRPAKTDAGRAKAAAPETDAGRRLSPSPEKAPAEAPAAPSGARLVAERCVQCHPIGVVYATKRTPAEWRAVVADMIRRGARLDDTEREAVIRHLVARGSSAE